MREHISVDYDLTKSPTGLGLGLGLNILVLFPLLSQSQWHRQTKI